MLRLILPLHLTALVTFGLAGTGVATASTLVDPHWPFTEGAVDTSHFKPGAASDFLGCVGFAITKAGHPAAPGALAGPNPYAKIRDCAESTAESYSGALCVTPTEVTCRSLPYHQSWCGRLEALLSGEGGGWQCKELLHTALAKLHDLPEAEHLPVALPDATYGPVSATEHIGDMITLIEKLIQSGKAYELDGNVYYSVSAFEPYGCLSRRNTKDLIAGARIEIDERKKSPLDFALWKSAKPGEPSWDSLWGRGRPGWHIECSAMSRRLLGKTFDIHGGGLDLIFPHHENEIAQSECCHGRAMANIWMHNGLLRAGEAGKVGGRAEREGNESEDGSSSEPSVAEASNAKLSRSKGAGGLHGLISRFGGERIRFFLLRTHYRSTIVFNDEGIEEAGSGLEKFYLFFERYQRISGEAFYLNSGSDSECRHLISTRETGNIDAGNDELLSEVATLRENFLSKMDDDFNSGAAVSDLFQLLSLLNKYADQQHLDDSKNASKELESFLRGVETLRELSSILGLFLKPVTNAGGGSDESLVDDLMQLLIDLRTDARANKDFATADKIRDTVTQMGIAFEDGKDGTRWRKS